MSAVKLGRDTGRARNGIVIVFVQQRVQGVRVRRIGEDRADQGFVLRGYADPALEKRSRRFIQIDRKLVGFKVDQRPCESRNCAVPMRTRTVAARVSRLQRKRHVNLLTGLQHQRQRLTVDEQYRTTVGIQRKLGINQVAMFRQQPLGRVARRFLVRGKHHNQVAVRFEALVSESNQVGDQYCRTRLVVICSAPVVPAIVFGHFERFVVPVCPQCLDDVEVGHQQQWLTRRVCTGVPHNQVLQCLRLTQRRNLGVLESGGFEVAHQQFDGLAGVVTATWRCIDRDQLAHNVARQVGVRFFGTAACLGTSKQHKSGHRRQQLFHRRIKPRKMRCSSLTRHPGVYHVVREQRLAAILLVSGNAVWRCRTVVWQTVFVILMIAALASPTRAELDLRNATVDRFDNGFTLIMLPDHRFPVASVQMLYRFGARNEVTGKTGLAHFLEHMAFRDTENFPNTDVVSRIYAVGGEWHGYTWTDQTTYYSTVPSEHIDLLLRIEADRMSRLKLYKKHMEAERGSVLAEMHMYENLPTSMLIDAVNYLSFLAHPYRNNTIGWESDIENLQHRDVVEFYEQHYQPANAVLAVVGDFEPG